MIWGVPALPHPISPPSPREKRSQKSILRARFSPRMIWFYPSPPQRNSTTGGNCQHLRIGRFHIELRFPASFEKITKKKLSPEFLQKDDLAVTSEGEESGRDKKRAAPWLCLLEPLWTSTDHGVDQSPRNPYCKGGCWRTSPRPLACFTPSRCLQTFLSACLCPFRGFLSQSSSSLRVSPHDHANPSKKVRALGFK